MDYNMIPAGSWPSQVDKEIQSQVEKGRAKVANNWDEIAAWISVDRQRLTKALEEYNNDCDKGHDTIFTKDKKFLKTLREPPFYAIKCCSNLLVTHGDLKVTPSMEVIDKMDNPIDGLYAAGDDTGDVDSGTYNMDLPGHSFSFAINSGRIAGESAAQFAAGEC
jgi:fumarate reductase flavoprotein subunit